jgi:type II secretory pathway component GspD/PulD (secretin)
MAVCLGLTGCHSMEWHDPVLERQRQDFQKLSTPPPPKLVPVKKPKVLSKPMPLVPQKRITLEAQKVPLTKVLEEIAQQANLSLILEISPKIIITYYARGRPLEEVLEDLSELYQLRFRLQDNVLRAENDVPFLAMSRTMENQTSINTSLFSGVDGNGPSSNNGSTSVLISKNTADFWEEVDHHLQMVLQTKPDPGDAKKPTQLTYAIHKQSGIISILGTDRQHKFVQQFLDTLRQQTQSQILIEAKVVEVTLQQQFKSGIDWSTVKSGDWYLQAKMGALADSTSPMVRNFNPISLGIEGRDLSSILNLLETFGTTRTLSSPRLTVMNNQNAVFKVAENQVFFTVKYERQFLNTDTQNFGAIIASTSKIQTIPIGLVMTVQPSIDPISRDITLTLRPTISRVVGVREDPSVQIVNNSFNTSSKTVKSEVPVVAVREMDSVLRIKSGQVAILGGLMIEGGDNLEGGLPGNKPGVLRFFLEGQRKANTMVELVIFLKATIVDSPRVTAADHRVYTDFMRDPRPILMPSKEGHEKAPDSL